MPAILSLTLLCVVLPENAAGKTDDMGKVRREQQTVRKKAKETAGKLDANKQKTALSLRELNTIAADIDRHERNIAMIERSVDDCDARLRLIGDSVRLSEQRLERLRGDYARAVRKMNARMASTDKLTFVLSSASVQPVKQSGYDMSDDELALSGSFESNKGRLPYPISGKCRVVRPFGRQRHPELRHVMTDNGGIDIEAPKGAVARAVFDGKVSAVFSQEGYGMVVMVRHGRYLTIYVNLSEIYVAVDSKVKTGQAIGVVSADADGGSQSVLHFEVRREKVKLNPMDWLK